MLMICPNVIKCEAPLPLDLSPALSGSDPLPPAPLRTQDPSRYQSINRSLTLGPHVCRCQFFTLASVVFQLLPSVASPIYTPADLQFHS